MMTQAARDGGNEVFLASRGVRDRYGGRSQMWLHRKLNDPASGFPQPIYIGRLRYWRLSDLLEFERKSAVASTRDRG